MKKLSFILLILLTSQESFSQNFFGNILNRMTFGIKAGANLSNFTNADFATDGLAGFHLGGTMNYRISNHFSIQEDIMYSTQGAKLKNNTFGKDKIDLAYLAVPIMIRYSLNNGLYLEGGPQANMLIKNEDKEIFPDGFADKVDAGIAAGIGYQFKDGLIKNSGISARYYQGFMDVGKSNLNNSLNNFHNTTLQVSVFYVF